MAINKPSVFPGVVKPRASIKVNGDVIDWLSVEIASTNTHRAATFEITLPTKGQTNKSFDKLADTDEMRVEIDMDSGDGTFVRLLTGRVDTYEEDVVQESTVFYGRDLSALLIDTKLTQKFVEITSSSIAGLFADEHKLKKDIQTTSLPVGVYYKGPNTNQYTQITSQTTEWNLLCFLAQNEGFNVYIDNDTLVFKAPSTTKNYYNIEWHEDKVNSQHRSANVLDLKFHRNMTIASDVSVLLKSWSAVDQKTYSSTARRKHTPHRNGNRQQYVAQVTGLSSDQTARMSQHLLEQISQHEKNLTVKLQGDTLLTPRSIMKVNGVSTRWDQLYYPYSIQRSLSFGGSFIMEVEAKNHSVNSQLLVT